MPGEELQRVIDEHNRRALLQLEWYKRELPARPGDTALQADFERDTARLDLIYRHCIRHMINLLAVANGKALPVMPGEHRTQPILEERETICQRGLAALATLLVFYCDDQVPEYISRELKPEKPIDLHAIMQELWGAKWDRPDIEKPSAWIKTAVWNDQRRAEQDQECEWRQFLPLDERGYGEAPAESLPFDFWTDREAAIRAAAGDDEEFASVVHELLAGVASDSAEQDRVRGSPCSLDDPDSWRLIAARRGVPAGQRKHFAERFKKRHRHRWYLLQKALWPYFREHDPPSNWGLLKTKEI